MLFSIAWIASSPLLCCGQNDFQQSPISYDQTQATDALAVLGQQLDAGEVELEWDRQHGWLPSLLKHLQVPASSQTVVFSKTSLQIRHISPTNPRAVYFSDDVYIGYTPGAPEIEMSAVDPQLGAVFYTLSADRKLQHRNAGASLADEAFQSPSIIRDKTNCLVCHATARTQRVPGYVVRSVFTQSSGQPRYEMGTTTTDHSTDLSDRFGGWFVTGQHGSIRHRGNVFVTGRERVPRDVDQGANLTKLPECVPVENYVRTTSDIVALMVLEHQSQMHNLITRAGYENRMALEYQKVMNKALDRDPDYVSDSTIRRIESAGDKLLEYLLFTEETELTAGVVGSEEFKNDFQKASLRDDSGRSLRDFDLQSRLFKYPCSFLIYSDSFDALPIRVREYVEQRLVEILQGKDKDKAFERLSHTEKTAILKILVATKPSIAKRVR